jgi:hypothetical protein
MNPITLRAHFDGEHIILEEPINLEPDTQLIVTVLPQIKSNGESHEDDNVNEDWVNLSIKGLEYAYGADEETYSLELIKEPNPEYEGR